MIEKQALASNDMNAVQEQARRDASPAGIEQDKRKRKIGVSRDQSPVVYSTDKQTKKSRSLSFK